MNKILAYKLGMSESDVSVYIHNINKAQKVTPEELNEIKNTERVAKELGADFNLLGLAGVYKGQVTEQRMFILKLKNYIASLGIKYNDQEAFDIGSGNKPLPGGIVEPVTPVTQVTQVTPSTPSSKIEAYHQMMREGKAKPALRKDIKTEDLIALKEKGLSYEEVANQSGLSRSAVIYRLKNWRDSNESKGTDT